MGVSISVHGLANTEMFLKRASKEVLEQANKAIIQSGFFIEGEVKDSIAGKRAEPKSVDTGRFLNSIKTGHNQKLTAFVETNVAYANFLEFGTSRIQARHHFANTAKRNENKVRDFVNKAVIKATK